MDEIEALEILKKELPSKLETEEERQNKAFWSKVRIIVISIICGLLLLLVIFYLAIHPIDRLKLYFALNDNFAISTTVSSSTTFSSENKILLYEKTQIDGNIMYDGNKYYEIDGERIYEYNRYGDMWSKSPYYQNVDDTDISIFEDLLNKDNYERSFLPWAAMKYKKPFMDNLEDVNMRMYINRFVITGIIKENNGLYTQYFYVTIEIKEFGLIDLELPKEGKIQKNTTSGY